MPKTPKVSEKRSLLTDVNGDKLHILVLFFLYVLQGIPTGLLKAVPLILSKRNVPYKDQAVFSVASFPYAVKLLWAPLVDSLYSSKFGRRKSWLVPAQYLIGITMLVSSPYISGLLGESEILEERTDPDVAGLTAVIFCLTFLAATQDVAVDGWALTMLKPSNVGYAATCNSVGVTTGWCLGYILFTVLDGYGIITLSQFLAFWGVVFLVTTTGIAFFKRENKMLDVAEGSGNRKLTIADQELGLLDTYKVLLKMFCHPVLMRCVLFLLTFGVGFSVVESMTNLKLIERGLPNEKIAMLESPLVLVKILVSLCITRFTVGPQPMNVWLVSFPFRILFSLAMVLVVYVAPLVILDGGEFSTICYGSFIVVFALYHATTFTMFVGLIAFYTRVSDPVLGGTYMTFFMTFLNLGIRWPISFNLWLVDKITYKQCLAQMTGQDIETNSTLSSGLELNMCVGNTELVECEAGGGVCITTLDGFYILSIGCLIFGCLWFIWAFRVVRRWQEMDVELWRVERRVETKDMETTGNEEDWLAETEMI